MRLGLDDSALTKRHVPANPWLATDGNTAPALLARDLRREWERFVSGGRLDGVRFPVADSRQRSGAAAVAPAGTPLHRYRGERRAVVTRIGRLFADDARGWLR
jgi:hypothetical protein